MKKSFTLVYCFCAVLLISEISSAKCFNFVNSQGPVQLGTLNFQKYTAKHFCIKYVHGFARSYTSFELSDEEGAILRLAVNVATGRCGADEYCKILDGLSGNALGKNLSTKEAKSISVLIETRLQTNLGILSGTLTDTLNKQKYLISELVRED